ncbi:unnamed protein product [Adineta steineri]|uniref:Uncharacterized protein n=1 Tax=Adineta steineri TaxID=433720 RepID=A0A813WGH4_9BILA|nr:unnamed protein product [Adineta steineri]CAF3838087.1 unnamed protein product [Adineta steineri]
MLGSMLGMSKTYNDNSTIQKAAIQSSFELIKESIDALDIPQVNIIADYGSSQGVNSIYTIKQIIDYLRQTNKCVKDPLVIHNDLPTNDWTSLFQLLVKDNSYYGVASGHSFYEQCLPNNSVGIGYCSTSIHWLSKKPCNILNHCLIDAVTCPKVNEEFRQQAYLDYCQFLKHRSSELISGGILILVVLATNKEGKRGNEEFHNILYECAQLLPFTSNELIDYTIPAYFRSYDECVDEKLFAQYSFDLIKSQNVMMEPPFLKSWKEEQITFDEFARLSTSFVRGWSESIVEQTLTNNGRTRADIPELLNQFWNLFEENLRKKPDLGNISFEYVQIALKKK